MPGRTSRRHNSKQYDNVSKHWYWYLWKCKNNHFISFHVIKMR